MIERGEVEPHFGFRGGDKPAQLEERYQAFPPTGLITFPKVVISDPHAQIGESDLRQRHDLIFGVIQFLHFAFACSKLFALSKDESQDSTGLFTVVQSRVFLRRWWPRARRAGDALPTLPPDASLYGKQVRLTGLADGLQCPHLRQQVLPL